MEANIRQAVFEDKENIINLISLLRLDIPDFVWDNGEFVEQQIKRGEYFIAKVGEDMAGAISFRIRGEKIHIETLAVKKEYRFNGIGTKFLNFAKALTREKKLNVLIACSFFEYNAENFYLQNGFRMLRKIGTYKGHQYHCYETKV